MAGVLEGGAASGPGARRYDHTQLAVSAGAHHSGRLLERVLPGAQGFAVPGGRHRGTGRRGAGCGAACRGRDTAPGAGQLPDHYRLVLTLRFLEGLSIKETAAEMGITEGNVKVLQLRALHRSAERGSHLL
ncbi:MAG: hypothetical protein EXR52_00895 [Dehalococcoidia bacterium]|nr:hypothetical protein [Dehalococcoidia bacterium]